MKKTDTFLDLVLRLEHLAGRSAFFGRVYARLFYHRMIRIEVRSAELHRDARVMHIGCGPFPITALALAGRGFEVTALDRDEETIRVARDRYGRSLSFVCADAREIDYSGYEAIFVALHVEPRQLVLDRIIATADPGARILLRNPRGSLNGRYTRLRAENCGLVRGSLLRRLPGQKELLVLRKPRAGDLPRRCTLCELALRQAGTISSVPDHPQLAAMGFRPGKDCTILAVQPLGGPIICTVAGRDVALERAIAENVLVEPSDVLS
ncbi:MAG: methyltransferase domain-containing protein [Spirochaetaceae bacterium]|nr:MAG: methyltransferase domain-containing protein [Spirochaetaceae bacterium]